MKGQTPRDDSIINAKRAFALGGHFLCFGLTSFTRYCHSQWREIIYEDAAYYMSDKYTAAQDAVDKKLEAMAEGFNDYVASGRENMQDSYAYIMAALYGEGATETDKPHDAVSVAEHEEADGVDIAEEHPVGVTEDGCCMRCGRRTRRRPTFS